MSRLQPSAGNLRLCVSVIVALGLAVSFCADRARAGVVVSGPWIEQKDWHEIAYIDFESHWQAVVDWGWRVTTAIHLNHEGVHGWTGKYYYNWYPGTITVTDPVLPTTTIAIPFMMMVDPYVTAGGQPGSNLMVPLPDDIVVDTASMEGLLGGQWHNATFDSFFDVYTDVFIDPKNCGGGGGCLPLTGPHGEIYNWNTSNLLQYDPVTHSRTIGDWYVAWVEMSADELSQVPEPSVLLPVAAGLLAFALLRRRR